MVRTSVKQAQRMLSRLMVTIAVGIFTAAGLADYASAVSEPIPTKVSLLKWAGSPPIGVMYKIVSKAPSPALFSLPAPGPSDPVAQGGELTVTVTGGSGSTGTLSCTLAAGLFDGAQGWKGLGNPAGSKGYKYINKFAPANDPCKTVIIKKKVIKVMAKSVGGITPPVDGPPEGPGNGDVETFLVAGVDGYCARASAQHAKEKANTLIKMQDQGAPASCTRCGDDSVNWLDEECDGNADSACPGRCIPPGSGGTCGDGVVNGGEECTCTIERCDGSGVDRSACPEVCAPTCVCPVPICGNGVKEEGEECEPRCEQGGCGDGEICGGFCECVPDVPCDCGSTDPTMYEFTTKAPTQAVCGTTDGDPPLDELACMGLYLGGGGGSMPVPNRIPDEATVKYNVECCQGSDLALTAETQAEVGILNCSEGKKCSATSEIPGAPCRRDRHCPGGSCQKRCLFAAPLEVLDRGLPQISVCTTIEVLEDSLGGVNCETGESFARLPLDARLFLSPSDMSRSTPGYQACPICFGGTVGVPNSGHCEGGPNGSRCTPCTGCPLIQCGDDSDCPPPRTCDIHPCTPQSTSYDAENCCAGGFNNAKLCSDNSDCPGSTCVSGCTQYPTSHDCPPHPLLEVGMIPISFALTTEASSKTANADGHFCGWCRDIAAEGTLCFEGDPDIDPSPGAKGCPDSAAIACRPATYHSDPPVGGDPADIQECDDPVSCNTDADCSAPYETCQQQNPGAFRDATIRSISYQGDRAGDLRTPGSHRGTTVSAFCVGPSFNREADLSGDVGGPAGVALEVDMQLSAE